MACLLFVSCDKESIQEKRLVGKWKLNKAELEQISYRETTVDEEYYESTYYIFYEEGTMKIIDEKNKIREYVYSLDMDAMTLTYGEYECAVEKLTKSSLILCLTTYFLDGTAPTQPAKGTVNTHYYFSKVK